MQNLVHKSKSFEQIPPKLANMSTNGGWSNDHIYRLMIELGQTNGYGMRMSKPSQQIQNMLNQRFVMDQRQNSAQQTQHHNQQTDLDKENEDFSDNYYL